MTYDQICVIESVCNAYAAANYWGFDTVSERVRKGLYQVENSVQKALEGEIPDGFVELYLTSAYSNLARSRG